VYKHLEGFHGQNVRRSQQIASPSPEAKCIARQAAGMLIFEKNSSLPFWNFIANSTGS